VGRGLLCLRVWCGARFVVPISGSQGEVCCAYECDIGRGLLCLRVWCGVRFAVSDIGAWGEICCA